MGNQQAARPFSDKDVAVLVKLSGRTENEIRQWYQEFHIETDGTDRMNKRQFQLYYSKLRKTEKIHQITDHIFRAFDTDHSGTIDFTEFLVAYIATTANTNRQRFEYAFEVFDINENNQVDRKEVRKILGIICQLGCLSKEDTESYTETVMLSFDSNHDKVLTKEEFIDGCLLDATLGKLMDPFSLH